MPKKTTRKNEKKVEKKEKLALAEVEKIVVEMGKKGTPPEKIGIILKKEHNVSKTKAYGIKINQILRKNNIEVDPNSQNLKKKVEVLRGHLANHKHDFSAKRALSIYEPRSKKSKRIYEQKRERWKAQSKAQ